jgi:pimeloyl-ACP methyl ester carboxylesterase
MHDCMKVSCWALTALFLIFLSSLAQGESLCSGRTYSEKINSHDTATIGYFQTVDPQGTLVFINGPEKSYLKSRSLIRNFCKHGFTVIAFDVHTRTVAGPAARDAHVIALSAKVAEKIIARVKQLKWQSPLVVYGWSKGAPAAIRVVKRQPSLFSKLILENPSLNSRDAILINHLPSRIPRIFVCPTDGKVSFRDLKLAGNATILTPAHAACGHQMSAYAEAQDPMVDFVESDFAGISTQNWYWARKL